MKDLATVRNIIANLDEEMMYTLKVADMNCWNFSVTNGRQKLEWHLKRVGLTWDEWQMWINEE